ncbi:HAD family hydrolase [Ammoniphilus sp. CFH 90114]|uniref:HAD family hydrolase n=1 Tax=Ammoniphilus sp. CFH 90114 TaxID=2493665 RepID=UPI001F0CD9DA|nr:HAD-IA family hydrolase [Ammoniphilus sp. CFH 90114]
MDDTLYCEHDYVRSGFRAVARELSETYRRNYPHEHLEHAIYEDMVEEWKQNGRGQIFDVVCRRYGIEKDISLLVNTYRQHVPENLSLYPDAERLLNYLKFKRLNRGIITDGDKGVQWRKIKAVELSKWFETEHMVVTDDLGRECWKPSPVPYQIIAERINLEPSECVYIGDNPHKDFVTARELGMYTIRVVRPTGDHMKIQLDRVYEADIVVNSLDELI